MLSPDDLDPRAVAFEVLGTPGLPCGRALRDELVPRFAAALASEAPELDAAERELLALRLCRSTMQRLVEMQLAVLGRPPTLQ